MNKFIFYLLLFFILNSVIPYCGGHDDLVSHGYNFVKIVGYVYPY